MKTLFLKFITIFLLTLSFNLKAQDIDRKKINQIREEISKTNIGLLKKLSKALKFSKNWKTREHIRVINIIDSLLKDSVYNDNRDLVNKQDSQNKVFKSQIEGLGNAMISLQTKLNEQSDQDHNKKPETDHNNMSSDAPVEDEEVNNDKYVADLISTILSPKKEIRLVSSPEKMKQISLIRNLMLQPIIYKDTLKDGTERERSIQLKANTEVWGFYPYTSGEIDLNYKIYSTLIINAFHLNGSTGRSFSDLDLRNYEVSKRALSSSCRLLLGVWADHKNTTKFLENEFAQQQFISKMISILAKNNMAGINIQLTELNKSNASKFLRFITNLSIEFKKNNRNLLVSVTIPSFDIEGGYEMNVLGSYVDRFLIDFTKKLPGVPGPLAPLKQQSDYSIETCVSRYLNNPQIPPSKFIIILPFYGVKWDKKIKTGIHNPSLISYSQVRARYQFVPITYDEQTASAIIETGDSISATHEKIWFDDEHTLDKKFDLVLNDGLGGVAIWDLTADVGYGELAEALAYKFLAIDTVTLKVRNTVLHNDEFGLNYIISNLKTYYYLLGNPCSDKNNEADYTVLSYITSFFGVISLALSLFCFYRIKNFGEQWKDKKIMLIITGIMSFFFITTLFAFIYIDADISWFGVDKECSDMPFLVLYMIIITGITLGIFLMRFLLFPIVKREDMP